MVRYCLILHICIFIINGFHPGEWDHWKNHMSPFTYPETAVVDFASMLVPNVDSVRTEFLLNTIAKQGKVISLFKHLIVDIIII